MEESRAEKGEARWQKSQEGRGSGEAKKPDRGEQNSREREIMMKGTRPSESQERTSILSMSILPYCLRISLLAVFIASTVAIVLRKFSVVREACSMLNVCCWSCEIWPS